MEEKKERKAIKISLKMAIILAILIILTIVMLGVAHYNITQNAKKGTETTQNSSSTGTTSSQIQEQEPKQVLKLGKYEGTRRMSAEETAFEEKEYIEFKENNKFEVVTGPTFSFSGTYTISNDGKYVTCNAESATNEHTGSPNAKATGKIVFKIDNEKLEVTESEPIKHEVKYVDKTETNELNVFSKNNIYTFNPNAKPGKNFTEIQNPEIQTSIETPQINTSNNAIKLGKYEGTRHMGAEETMYQEKEYIEFKENNKFEVVTGPTFSFSGTYTISNDGKYVTCNAESATNEHTGSPNAKATGKIVFKIDNEKLEVTESEPIKHEVKYVDKTETNELNVFSKNNIYTFNPNLQFGRRQLTEVEIFWDEEYKIQPDRNILDESYFDISNYGDEYIKFLPDGTFTAYHGWGIWLMGSYEVKDNKIYCNVEKDEEGIASTVGKTSAKIVFEIKDSKTIEIIEAPEYYRIKVRDYTKSILTDEEKDMSMSPFVKGIKFVHSEENIVNYIGVWQDFEKSNTEIPERELIVKGIENNKINFDLYVYRTAINTDMVATLDGNVATFDCEGGKYDAIIKGTLKFENNKVILNVESCSEGTIPTGITTFEIKSATSKLK